MKKSAKSFVLSLTVLTSFACNYPTAASADTYMKVCDRLDHTNFSEVTGGIDFQVRNDTYGPQPEQKKTDDEDKKSHKHHPHENHHHHNSSSHHNGPQHRAGQPVKLGERSCTFRLTNNLVTAVITQRLYLKQMQGELTLPGEKKPIKHDKDYWLSSSKKLIPKKKQIVALFVLASNPRLALTTKNGLVHKHLF